jgi:serine/threonine protein kinase
MKVMSDLRECTCNEQETLCFLMINSIAVEYHRANLFHGDIKPENIFFYDEDDEFFCATSDVGSLLHLGEPNE